MALHSEGKTQEIKLAIEELKRFGQVDVTYNLTILSVVGKHMKRMIGIAGKMFMTLAEAGVNIEMISQGK